MLKYLRLLCKLPEYLESDFCIKKSAQETNICMARLYQRSLMRYVLSKELNTV